MNFDSLAKRIVNRDERAFEELYKNLNRAVFSVCFSVIKNDTVAVDLSQDTFVAVWNNIDTFKGVGFKTWVLTIAKNKSINYLNKRKREIITDFTEDEYHMASDSSDIESSIILKCALEKLDSQDRQIVLLKNSGMKMKEIAEYLNIPRGTASWRYSEAIKILKKEVEVVR